MKFTHRRSVIDDVLNNFRHDILCPTPISVESEATPAHRKLLIGTQLGRIYLVRNEEVRLSILSDRSLNYLVRLGDDCPSLLLLGVLLKC